jgi:hypothetical protein
LKKSVELGDNIWNKQKSPDPSCSDSVVAMEESFLRHYFFIVLLPGWLLPIHIKVNPEVFVTEDPREV